MPPPKKRPSQSQSLGDGAQFQNSSPTQSSYTAFGDSSPTQLRGKRPGPLRSRGSLNLKNTPGGWNNDDSGGDSFQVNPNVQGQRLSPCEIVDSDDEDLDNTVLHHTKTVTFNSPPTRRARRYSNNHGFILPSLSKPLREASRPPSYAAPSGDPDSDHDEDLDAIALSSTSPAPPCNQEESEDDRVTGFVRPLGEALQIFEVDADGNKKLIGTVDHDTLTNAQASGDRNTLEVAVRLINLCIDTVHTAHREIQDLKSRFSEVSENLVDERVNREQAEADAKQAKDSIAYADSQNISLSEELRQRRADNLADVKKYQDKVAALEQRKNNYKDLYHKAYDNSKKANEEVERLRDEARQSTARMKDLGSRLSQRSSRPRGNPDDNDSSSSDDDQGRPRPPRNPFSGRDHRDRRRSPSPRPRALDFVPEGRRSKHPEPALFGKDDTSTSTYTKWKLDIKSWFNYHPRDFGGQPFAQLDYLRMKTVGAAWDSISDGWLVAGEEFDDPQQV